MPVVDLRQLEPSQHKLAPPGLTPERGFSCRAPCRPIADCPITFHDSERNVRYMMRAGCNGPASCFFLLRELARRVVAGNSPGGLSRGRAPGGTIAVVLD